MGMENGFSMNNPLIWRFSLEQMIAPGSMDPSS
jgi:hypothetical protein